MRVLSINCGSSSLKYALFEGGGRGEQVAGIREQANDFGRDPSAGIREQANDFGEVDGGRGSVEKIKDHAAAVRSLLEDLTRRGTPPDVVGHRVVHGGSRSEPARVDDALLSSLRDLVPFAPLHLPPEIRAIEAVTELLPGKLQVACFDTAFHRTLSPVAQRYALPDEWHDKGIHRYGFHGLSYEYVVGLVGARELGRAVIAHLGSGASLAAIREGRSVDTTMGFSPAGGIVMGTRLGDVDPGVLVHLMEGGLDAKAIDDLVNRRSGLLGVSGTTADVRDLLARRTDDARAALAIDVFTWNARKAVGAMAASAGGLDTLVFTGGIGENAPAIRAEIAAGLGHLGVVLDPERNARAAKELGDRGGLVSAGSGCKVRVVQTDEELMVARHAARAAAS